jgi:hypothetical protein
MRTEKEWCKLALDIQDACNFSAVARELVSCVSELYKDSDQIIKEPSVILLVDKLSSLCGTQFSPDKVYAAYDHCYQVTKHE